MQATLNATIAISIAQTNGVETSSSTMQTYAMELRTAAPDVAIDSANNLSYSQGRPAPTIDCPPASENQTAVGRLLISRRAPYQGGSRGTRRVADCMSSPGCEVESWPLGHDFAGEVHVFRAAIAIAPWLDRLDEPLCSLSDRHHSVDVGAAQNSHAIDTGALDGSSAPHRAIARGEPEGGGGLPMAPQLLQPRPGHAPGQAPVKRYAAPDRAFARRYTAADVALLATDVDRAMSTLSRPATRACCAVSATSSPTSGSSAWARSRSPTCPTCAVATATASSVQC